MTAVPGQDPEERLSSHPWDAEDHRALAARLGAERSLVEALAVQRLAELVGVVFRLRDDDGCPWDRKQTLPKMAAHLLEEATETVDAVAGADPAHMAEELGDTLMNVLLMARIAADEGLFDLAEVAAGISEKLVRRHPHVFGDFSAEDAEAALTSWNDSKARERQGQNASILDDVPGHLPVLAGALALGQRAAGSGFDWPDTEGAMDKLREEVAELDQACQEGPAEAIEDELGDVLFSAVNVARQCGVDPEFALRRTMAKFRRRFAALESALGDGLSDASLVQLEALWREAAHGEGQRGPGRVEPG